MKFINHQVGDAGFLRIYAIPEPLYIAWTSDPSIQLAQTILVNQSLIRRMSSINSAAVA